MQIQFYHLLNTGYQRALPALMQKAMQANYRVGIKLGSAEEMKQLDDWLWSYSPESFLPHGTEKTDHPTEHPIYLSTQLEFPNKANILAITDGSYCEEGVENIERVLDLFDGNDPTLVQAARDRWRNYKEAGHELAYWQQQPNGGWKKAA